MPDQLHGNLTGVEIHTPFTWVVADVAAMAALAPALEDVNKTLLKQDDMTVYVLTSHSPVTWVLTAAGPMTKTRGLHGRMPNEPKASMVYKCYLGLEADLTDPWRFTATFNYQDPYIGPAAAMPEIAALELFNDIPNSFCDLTVVSQTANSITFDIQYKAPAVQGQSTAAYLTFGLCFGETIRQWVVAGTDDPPNKAIIDFTMDIKPAGVSGTPTYNDSASSLVNPVLSAYNNNGIVDQTPTVVITPSGDNATIELQLEDY